MVTFLKKCMKSVLHTFKNVWIYAETPPHSEPHSGKYVTSITHTTEENTVAFHSFPQYIKRRKVCNERVITQTALPPIPPQSGLLLEKWSLILICPELDYS